MKVTFTPVMAVRDITTFLNDYNSPGKGSAQLDKVWGKNLRKWFVLMVNSWTTFTPCPAKLSLDGTNTDNWKLCLWSKSSFVHHPLFVVYVWLVSDCSVSSLTGSQTAIQETDSINTGPREILSCRDSEHQNLSVNTQRHWLLILRKFVKLSRHSSRILTNLSCMLQIQEYLVETALSSFILKYDVFHWQIMPWLWQMCLILCKLSQNKAESRQSDSVKLHRNQTLRSACWQWQCVLMFSR